MQIKNLSSRNYLCYTTSATLNTLLQVIGTNVEQLIEESKKLGLNQTGPVEFIYFDCTNDMDKVFTLEIGIPVKENTLPGESKYQIKNFGEFKCTSYIHKGSIKNLYNVYENIFGNIFREAQKPTNQVREVYEKYLGMDSEENITEIQVGLE